MGRIGWGPSTLPFARRRPWWRARAGDHGGGRL